MPQTVEVRFKGIRRDFFVWPDDQEPLRLKEAVVVECERGQDFGRVQTAGEAALKKCGGGCSGCEVGTADKAPVVAEGTAEESEQIHETDQADQHDHNGHTAHNGHTDHADHTEEPAPSSAPPLVAPPGLRPILRRASQDDIGVANELRRSEEDARRQATDKVRQHKLDMKVSDAEWQWDRSKLTLFFTAEKRVDFRSLVRDLAAMFRTRIELRQIGVRDEAARLGGVGRCGREYCCSTWLSELSPVSLALAKDQHLSLNPTQISGGCGRLLCCLKYEHEFYVAARKRFPREGKMIATTRGSEKVVAVDIFRERVFLRNEEGSRIVPLIDLKEEMENAAAMAVGGVVSDAAAPLIRPNPTAESRPPRQSDRRATGPREQPDRPERPRHGWRREPPAAPPAANPAPTPPAPPPVPAAEAAAPDSAGPRRPRRRRRGRRGGRGNPGSPPTPPTAPEG
jgi:cell fate regulator YaaT (PSP1 superfamily)